MIVGNSPLIHEVGMDLLVQLALPMRITHCYIVVPVTSMAMTVQIYIIISMRSPSCPQSHQMNIINIAVIIRSILMQL